MYDNVYNDLKLTTLFCQNPISLICGIFEVQYTNHIFYVHIMHILTTVFESLYGGQGYEDSRHSFIIRIEITY